MNAEVPFIYHCVQECDNYGLNYSIEDHQITLKVPEGAIAKGEKLHFEIGVTLYGPFNFPIDSQPISPIVWLCIVEENAKLYKPFQLVLPHFLTYASVERMHYHEVQFAKANHLDINQDGYYNFISCDEATVHESIQCVNYSILEAQHFCFYCLKAKKSAQLAKDARYYLVRIENILQPCRNEVYFCVVYFLETCLKVIIIYFLLYVYEL